MVIIIRRCNSGWSTTKILGHVIGQIGPTLSTTSSLSLLHQDDRPASRRVTTLQRHLVSILANCLSFLKHLSPNMSQIMLDEGLAAGKSRGLAS